jgi:hypothetical protein
MGTRLTCCFPNGTRPLRHRCPAIPERRRIGSSLRHSASGAHFDIRGYRVARSENQLEVRSSRCAHRRRRHTHVCRSHSRATGAVAIPSRPHTEGCWRRRRWNGAGAASDGYELAGERRFLRKAATWTRVSLFCMGTGCILGTVPRSRLEVLVSCFSHGIENLT